MPTHPLVLKTNSSSPEVLIIGAGPTGLLLAILLQRWQVNFRLIDQSEQQAHESRALGIQPRTLELLASLNLVQKFLSRGQVAKGASIFVNGQRKADVNFSDIGRDDTPYPYLFFLSQAETEKILVEELERGENQVEYCTEFLSFERITSSESLIVKIRKNVGHDGRDGHGPIEVVKPHYLVGCDGAHSKVRKQLGLNFIGGLYQQDFILADSQIDWAYEYDRLMVFFGPETLAAIFPMQGKALSRILTISLDQPNPGAPASLSEVQSALKKSTQTDVQLKNPVWVSRFRIHHRGVERYLDRDKGHRIFLAGDSAHIHSPIGAQGMNTGLQDAANLGWKLALALRNLEGNPMDHSDDLLESYHRERWPIGQKLLRFTDRLFVGISSPRPWVNRVRNSFIPLFAKFFLSRPRGRRFVFNFISQLNIRYHQSEFIQEDLSTQIGRSLAKKLPAGYRMPNFPLKKNLEMFDLLKGYCFHLLLFPSQSYIQSQESPSHVSQSFSQWEKQTLGKIKVHIVDWPIESDEIFSSWQKLGIYQKGQPTFFIIRPDQYIAFRSDKVDLVVIQQFLQKLGVL